MPHHFHVSTPALFVVALFICALVWILTRPRKVVVNRVERVYSEAPAVERTTPQASGDKVYADAPTSGYYSPPRSAYAAPPQVVTQSGGNDLLTGVLLGEAMSGGIGRHDTTIIERDHYSSYFDFDKGGGGRFGGGDGDGGITLDSGSGTSSDTGGVDFGW